MTLYLLDPSNSYSLSAYKQYLTTVDLECFLWGNCWIINKLNKYAETNQNKATSHREQSNKIQKEQDFTFWFSFMTNWLKDLLFSC